MKHAMRILIGLLNRTFDLPGEHPIHTSTFKIAGYWDSAEEKEDCRKNLKILKDKGWIELYHDPFTTNEKLCGKIFGGILDPGGFHDITRTNDPVKQEMLGQGVQ